MFFFSFSTRDSFIARKKSSFRIIKKRINKNAVSQIIDALERVISANDAGRKSFELLQGQKPDDKSLFSPYRGNSDAPRNTAGDGPIRESRSAVYNGPYSCPSFTMYPFQDTQILHPA